MTFDSRATDHVMKFPWPFSSVFPPFLHTTSDQKLEVYKAWEQG